MEPPPAAPEAEAVAGGPAPVARTTSRPAAGLLVALLLACLYAAFAQGASADPGAARLQVLVAALAAVAAAAWAGIGERMRARSTRAGWIGLAGVSAFAAWSGLSLAWSVAPDQTWLATNQAIAYALIVGLGLVVGTRAHRAVERVALGLLAVAGLAAIYALLTLAVPGLALGGLLDLDRAGVVPRLTAPVGTWEGLGLLCALSFPVAVRLAADPDLRDRARGSALALGLLLACVPGIADARVAFLAGGAAIVVAVVCGSRPVRTLVISLATVVLAVPVVAVARGLEVGSGPVRALDARESDGLVVLLVLVGCLAALLGLALVARKAFGEPGREVAEERFPAMLAGGLAALLVAGVVIGVTTGALLDVDQGPALGLRGAPAQSASADRSTWWSEALGSASDAPVGGHGAGSFAVEHRERRAEPVEVTQPHSLAMQLLSDTGGVGFLLLLGGLLALGWAATRRVLALEDGRERDLAAALLAIAAAWFVHALLEDDLTLPAVTVPALLALGVLAARPSRPLPVLVPPRRAIVIDPREESRGRGTRLLVVAVAALALACVVASSVLPSVAADQVAQAREAAATGTAAGLQEGSADAALAARLDPLSVQPLLAGAAIEQRRGSVPAARSLLLEAVGRQPRDAGSWARLSELSSSALDFDGAASAAKRAAALDPRSPSILALARRAQSGLVPPALSATATGTPLGDATAVETVPGG